VGIRRGDFNFESHMENSLVAVDRYGGMVEAQATYKGQHEIVRMKGRRTILAICCIQSMLYSVYAVLGVCCTWCMLYLVYAALNVNS
jgi:hypothetical protein